MALRHQGQSWASKNKGRKKSSPKRKAKAPKPRASKKKAELKKGSIFSRKTKQRSKTVKKRTSSPRRTVRKKKKGSSILGRIFFGLWGLVTSIFSRASRKARGGALGKNLLLAGIAGILFASTVFLGMFAWISRDLPDPNTLSEREVAQSTKIYDRSGEKLLYEIAGDQKRTLVTLEDIPDYVISATITAEDRDFYEHGGIDYTGILRAALFNVATLDPTGQGGSTITQQLVKNAILTNEQTYTRKLKEVILALALERRYTKDEILQLYLNEIPYGSTNYGIESASLTYFDKHVRDLSIAEAATIASLPKAPTTYLNDPESLLARRDWIISEMAELEYITEGEAKAAIAEDTSIALSLTNIDAPHFVLWVKEQLEEEYGERTVEQGGLTVITSLDFDMQEAAEEAAEANREARSESYGFNNSGLVAIDPGTGEILAMVGSVDYFDDDIDGQVNVTLAPLQPGSSFKPIVYTAAFEAGYTPNTVLWDVETDHPSTEGAYSPKNYDLSEHGPVTVRSALQGSLNIPAVKMLDLIGLDAGVDFAERLGYTTLEDRSRFGLSVVLGGAEVKLIEHVSAYGVFANGGIYQEPVSILKVEDPDGEVLEEWEFKEGDRVVEANLAYMISDVLSDDASRAPYFGGGGYLTLSGRDAAAKTGTTNDSKDAWTVGYTPSLVAGVWTGNTDGTAMAGGAGGSSVAAPIWNAFMYSALEGTGADWFPDTVIDTTGKAILDGSIPSETVTIDTASGKLATDRTPERFRYEVTCGEYHTILHFVDRYDPRGGIPEDPAGADGDYETWEGAVQTFIEESNAELEEGEVPIGVCDVPTEEDDLHVKANEPDVKIENPDSNDSVGREFDVDVDADAPRSVDRLEFFIDDTFVRMTSVVTGATISLPSWVDTGTHTLKVIAYDDIDNAGSDTVKIKVNEASEEGSLTITNPFNGQEIERTGDGYSIAVETSAASSINSIVVSIEDRWSGVDVAVLSTDDPSSLNAFSWALPEPGTYLINVSAELEGGGTIEASPIEVTVVDPADLSGFSLTEEETEE